MNKALIHLLYASIQYIVPLLFFYIVVVHPTRAEDHELASLAVFGTFAVLLLIYASKQTRGLSIHSALRRIASTIVFTLLLLLLQQQTTVVQSLAMAGSLVVLTAFFEALIHNNLARHIDAHIRSAKHARLTRHRRRQLVVSIGVRVTGALVSMLFILTLAYITFESSILGRPEDSLVLMPYHVIAVVVLMGQTAYAYYKDKKEWFSKIKHVLTEGT